MNTTRMALREAMLQVVRIMDPSKALCLRKVGAGIVIMVRLYHHSDGGAHPL